jgi:hypothetical protein
MAAPSRGTVPVRVTARAYAGKDDLSRSCASRSSYKVTSCLKRSEGRPRGEGRAGIEPATLGLKVLRLLALVLA